MLCQYKDSLGKPGEGVHSYRLLDIAIFDVIFTVIGAAIIHYFMPQYKFIVILASLFALGIILHHAFCVRTTVDKWLFR
jgi:hypothetical protein